MTVIKRGARVHVVGIVTSGRPRYMCSLWRPIEVASGSVAKSVTVVGSPTF